MSRLLIQHTPNSTPPTFQVARSSDGKRAEPVAVPSPAGYPVLGRPQSDLRAELRWYLEDFLDYPFPPESDHAERVTKSLRDWGDAAFNALFGSGQARDWYRDITRNGFENLEIAISCNDPMILAWPWEALRDPIVDFLGLTSQIERVINRVADPLPLPEQLPQDRINILMVTARPFPADVGYRSLSRPLVELISNHDLPAEVTILRPPTFEHLQECLRERPGFYHIVHFDGHGGYASPSDEDSLGSHAFQGATGHLVFENASGAPDPIPAPVLSTTLREHRIPVVVLNACQSGMVDEHADDAFASVAAALLHAGIRSVVAMGYSVFVSGMQHFLPAFYHRLFIDRSLVTAVRAGRQAMNARPGRVSPRGLFPLQDWLVPVVYQQEALRLTFGTAKRPEKPAASQGLPSEVGDAENPYGLIGRDDVILQLERALTRPPAGILVQGLAGVGKTTIARGFVQWLAETNGLGDGAFWFGFNEIRLAEPVLNRLGEAVIGTDFSAWSLEKKLPALTRHFKAHRNIIVWDNFEAVRGVPGTSEAKLGSDDQALLVRFLKELRGGQTKVLITSRSEEEWLGPQQRFLLRLGGLQHEERWEYCEAILRDLGLGADHDDPSMSALMNRLGGHPLMMRVMLSKIENKTPSQLLGELDHILAAAGPDADSQEQKLFATLRFVEDGLPPDLQLVLLLISLHEGFLDLMILAKLASVVARGLSPEKPAACIQTLSVAGLIHHKGGAIYELHPALTTYLRARKVADQPTWEACASIFLEVFGFIADTLPSRQLDQQRAMLHFHGENLRVALKYAEGSGRHRDAAIIVRALAAFAHSSHDLTSATRGWEQFAEYGRLLKEPQMEASAMNALGIIARERRDLAAADEWGHKSLAINQQLRDERQTATIYHQLGTVAYLRGDLEGADQLYRKSLDLSERFDEDDMRGVAAKTYHHLGLIAEARQDLPGAEQWARKSLEVSERIDDRATTAGIHHQLGTLAYLQGNFAAAEQSYRTSLKLSEALHDPFMMGKTYHHLGLLEKGRQNLAAAESLFLKALAILENFGPSEGAKTYYELGGLAADRHDFRAARQWYHKCIEIEVASRDMSGLANSSFALGKVEFEAEAYREAGDWFIRARMLYLSLNNSHMAEGARQGFSLAYEFAGAADRAALGDMWTNAGLGSLPDV